MERSISYLNTMRVVSVLISAIYWQIGFVESSNKGEPCGPATSSVKRVHQMGILYSLVPPCLAIITLAIGVLLAISIRKWQSTEVKTLNDAVKKVRRDWLWG